MSASRRLTGANPFVEEALRWLPENKGTSAEELPLDRDLLPVPCPPGQGAWNRRRIVIADDNRDLRQYLARLLSERYEVVAVADGKLALDSIQEKRPDLIVSDIMMPNLDGFGLLKAVRSVPPPKRFRSSFYRRELERKRAWRVLTPVRMIIW